MKYYHLFIIIIFITSCAAIPQPYESNFEETFINQTRTNEIVEFKAIDVGQGDATLITTPNGKQILIDAGTPEMGRERVLPEILGNELALIICSHYDLDHAGGIAEVIKGADGVVNTVDDNIPSEGFLDRGDDISNSSNVVSDYFIITADKRYSLTPGEQFMIDDVGFMLLAANGVFSDGTILDIDPENENAHSLSLLITYRNVSYLTSGDLPGPNSPDQYEPIDLESQIAQIIDDVDILHVSHHGSHKSTSRSFLDAITPDYAIISAGENDYGHPTEIVLQNLRNINSEIFLTEGDWIENQTGLNIINGNICVKTDGAEVMVNTCD